jgi:hypothetical protein
VPISASGGFSSVGVSSSSDIAVLA